MRVFSLPLSLSLSLSLVTCMGLAGDRFVFDQALLCLHFKVLFADSTAELQQAMDAVLSSFEDESHPMHRRFPHEILYAACYQ